MSCISLSVGLGNVWRFPFNCLDNGGKVFVTLHLPKTTLHISHLCRWCFCYTIRYRAISGRKASILSRNGHRTVLQQKQHKGIRFVPYDKRYARGTERFVSCQWSKFSLKCSCYQESVLDKFLQQPWPLATMHRYWQS